MPYFTKEALSKYIRTGCRRQLRLNLSPDNREYRPEREQAGMPPPLPPPPGLYYIREAGEQWGAAKVADLARAFGAAALIGRPKFHAASGQTRYEAIPLATALAQATVGQFLVEAEYSVGPAFQQALGIAHFRERFGLAWGLVRPDLIELRPPGSFPQAVRPDGDVCDLAPDDPRVQLRVIDIKLTAEPSPPYFAEVAYYSMALAGWLDDQHLADRYVVVAQGAVWPGSHDASTLVKVLREHEAAGRPPDRAALQAALDADLEPVPFEAFAFRLRQFFTEELPHVLEASWRVLPFHVDTRCRSCEYLGYRWQPDPQLAASDYCMPLAHRQGHLSQVAFISRGASAALQEHGVRDVAALAALGAQNQIYEVHHELRAQRAIVASRAAALQQRQAWIPDHVGTSAIMPRWADLRVYLSADFDVGSAITLALGVQAVWWPPQANNGADDSGGAPVEVSEGTQSPNGPGGKRRPRTWQRVFVVDQKSLEVERRELLAFLAFIHSLLQTAQQADPKATVQCYLWDSLEYEHLKRVVGRHLPAILSDQSLDHLAWLFPPPELLPNPKLATRRSPLTLVRDVVRAVLAAPIPHYYTLLATARVYHPPDTLAKAFSVHPLFEDPLSDQIPSERAHEIWARTVHPRHWQEQLGTLVETVRRRLGALEAVTRQLERDLRPRLGQSAPRARDLRAPDLGHGLSASGALWYAFARLNAALAELEVHQKRAMPPHEREARYESARLRRRLEGAEAQQALAALGLEPQPGRMVYELRPASCEVKLREGEFNVALSPERQDGFLDLPFGKVTAGTWLEPAADVDRWRPMERVLGVTIVAIDRDHGLMVLDADRRQFVTAPDGTRLSMFEALEQLGRADFSRTAIVDPVSRDYFTRRLLTTLRAIGDPAVAQASPFAEPVLRALGRRPGRWRPSSHTPAADVLWNARALAETPVPRDLAAARARLEQHGRALNASQWQAWEAALTRRLQLIWGPPGTGKSRTVVSVILGALLAAAEQGRALRVLVSGPTYTAIDNVLLELYTELAALLPAVHADGVFRLRSAHAVREPHVPEAIDVELATPLGPAAQALGDRLAAAQASTVVGGTVQQVHNLLTGALGGACRPVFDLIVIDEASQLDVAGATLALAGLAEGGSVVLAGDPLQLAPIHTAPPPLGLEAHVGSIYTYCAEAHGVPPTMLEENYRSNATLVELAHVAGYARSLRSYSPDLRLHLRLPLPTARPPDWPAGLYWTPAWGLLLDPAYPAVCFVYPDGRASQANPFEADAVAALVWLLAGRLACRPAGERDPCTGALRPVDHTPYTPVGFWTQGVGVVTPHRAQQGLIISRLREVFPAVAPSLVRGAVDTVERFQGQQRDVILASFALGDPDAIAREDEFLHNLNRFNVLASRARAKLIVLISQELVDHLSGELEILRASRLLKLYCQSFCRGARDVALGRLVDGQAQLVRGWLRVR
ncbi:MAG TPA: AAA domain-containing protein [Chloroflexota bacterium]|nr:AAA domain-containing protein [Chloroflexota bacterium]